MTLNFDRREVQQALDDFVGEERQDLSTLHTRDQTLREEFGTFRRTYESTIKYFKSLGVFTDWLGNYLRDESSKPSGVFGVFHDALAALRRYVDTGRDQDRAEARQRIDEAPTAATDYADRMDKVLAGSVEQQGREFTGRLDRLSKQLAEEAERSEGVKREIYGKLASTVEGLRTDHIRYQTEISAVLDQKLTPVQKDVVDLQGSFQWLIGEIKAMRKKRGLPLSMNYVTDDSALEQVAPLVEAPAPGPTNNVERPSAEGEGSQPNTNPSGTP